MKKTKIICSVGPACDNVDVMSEMVLKGMNCARINLSHSTEEESLKVIDVVREVRNRTGAHVAIMYDTKGPEFRTMEFEDSGINILEGETIMMVSSNVLGNKERFSVNHPEVIKNLKVGNHVLIDNALLDLEVIDVLLEGVLLKAINSGFIGNHKSINVPGVNLNLPFISDDDYKDISFAATHSCDYLALSFVNCRDDVIEARKIIEENGGDARIISKIESQMGIDNIDSIIEESDGIMVARGDLGVEVPIEKLPFIQKEIIRKCRENGKFAIVATEMLASMYENPRPTRAEVSDVYNAVLDGTDCVMLSGETTVGKHPIEAVDFMSRICVSVEESIDYSKQTKYLRKISISDTIAKLVVDACLYDDIKAVVTTTMTGYTARKISNFRPNCPIVAYCPSNHIAEKVTLNFGVLSQVIPIYEDNDKMINDCVIKTKELLNLKEGDLIVLTGGLPLGKSHNTNFIKIVEV